MPRAERGYLIRSNGALIAFVPHPEIAGMWFRTDASVITTECAKPGCGARPGEPCKSTRGWSSQTHYHRRNDGKEAHRKLQGAFSIVFDLQLRLARRKPEKE